MPKKFQVPSSKFQVLAALVAVLCLAGSLPVERQAAFFRTPTSGGGVVTDTAYVTAVTHLDASFNTVAWKVGAQLTMSSTVTVTSLGGYVFSGDATTNAIELRDNSCTLLGTVIVDKTGQTPGTFVYATLSSPVMLTSGQSYYLLQVMAVGGNKWSDNGNTVTTTAVATQTAATDSGGGCTFGSGQMRGPVDFKYH